MVAIVSRRVTVFWLPDSRPQSHALQTSQKEAMPPRSRVAKPADDGNDDEEDRPIDVDAANAPSILGIGGQALPYKPAPSSPFPRDVGYISVEYPGFVANIDKVYETLGGKEAIVKVRRNLGLLGRTESGGLVHLGRPDLTTHHQLSFACARSHRRLLLSWNFDFDRRTPSLIPSWATPSIHRTCCSK